MTNVHWSKQKAQQAQGMMCRWIDAQRGQKIASQQHQVALDICMERVHSYTPAELALTTQGEQVLASLDAMQSIDLAQVWQKMQVLEINPPGGAGGLGIIAETMAWTGVRFGSSRHFGLVMLSPMVTERRVQTFAGNRQVITPKLTSPYDSSLFLPLAKEEILFNHQPTEVETWLFTGFRSTDGFVPSVSVSKPGDNGVQYASHDSQENFDQMYVLGAAGLKFAQRFGLLGTSNPLVDKVIGHDGHTAVFKFNLFLWFYKEFKGDFERALAEAKKICRATIHAPQNGTVPRTTGEMVRKQYLPEEEVLYGKFGLDPFKPTNALFIEMQLSGRVGVVSPLHLMTTQAEEKAVRRGYAADANKLLPDNISPEELLIYPDTIDPRSWLGMGTQWVLDHYLAGWDNALIDQLEKPELIDNLRANKDFRHDLAQAFTLQEQQLLAMLSKHFPKKYGKDMPAAPIIFGSLRRATSYKLDLAMAFLNQAETMNAIARKLGHPIFYLFGGLAHKHDTWAINDLERLLNLVEQINRKYEFFKADFLMGYDYEKARWLFPGLAVSGCWVGATNPLANRSQGCEAFGPSYLKAVMNGDYIIGPHDAGAACLNDLPTVRIFGLTTFAGDTSFHSDLWSNLEIKRMSKFLLENGFIRTFEEMAMRLSDDLVRYKLGKGDRSPGMDAKIISMLTSISRNNGMVLMNRYLES